VKKCIYYRKKLRYGLIACNYYKSVVRKKGCKECKMYTNKVVGE
jgi:hypothetical protein